MKTNLVKVVLFSLIAIIIVGASFLFATRYIYRSKAGVNDVVAQLQPATITTALNTPFTVAVWLQSDTSKRVSAATIPIQYDTAKLEYIAPDTSDATCNAIDTQVSLTNNNGQIVWSKVTFKAGTDLPKGLFCFGKLQFKLTSGTSATISYSTSVTAQVVGPDGALTLAADPSHSSVTVSTSAGASTPTPTPTIPAGVSTPTPTLTPILCGSVECLPGWQCVSQVCVPISPTPTPTVPAGVSSPTPTPTTPPSAGTPVLNFKLKLQGVQAKPSGANEVPLRFTIVKKDGSFSKIFANVTGTFNDGGNVVGTITLDGVTPGNGYRILVKGPKHLQRKYCDIVPASTENGAYICGEDAFALVAGVNTFDSVAVPLLVGDLSPQDGLLNAFDIAQMNLNLLLGDADALNVADVNYDGFVNSTDFSLLIQSMQLKYDEEQ